MDMKIKCEIDGHICELPDSMGDFFVRTTVIYCSTLSTDKVPHIHPVIFINETNSCIITFVVNKQSTIAINLSHNPKLSLAIDITHPIDPFCNRGISINASSQLDESKEAVKTCVSHLQEKYGYSTVAKICGLDTTQQFVRVRVQPFKIIYWKGPYFKRFRCASQQKMSSTSMA
jgi:hypothetical protein